MLKGLEYKCTNYIHWTDLKARVTDDVEKVINIDRFGKYINKIYIMLSKLIERERMITDVEKVIGYMLKGLENEYTSYMMWTELIMRHRRERMNYEGQNGIKSGWMCIRSGQTSELIGATITFTLQSFEVFVEIHVKKKEVKKRLNYWKKYK